MNRLLIWLMLSSFLRLQMACCCAGHVTADTCHRGLAAGTTSACESCHHCEHSTASPDKLLRDSTAAEHADSQPQNDGSPAPMRGSSDNCHVCVLTHLKYIPTTAACVFELAPGSLSSYSLPEMVDVRVSAATNLNAAARSGWAATLLNCGTLLRI